jgi:hypothetical protein
LEAHVTHDTSLTPDDIRRQLAIHEEIVHSTIEIHQCPDAADHRLGHWTGLVGA